jgi:hypothetical protein
MQHIQIATDKTIRAILPPSEVIAKMRAQGKALVAKIQSAHKAKASAKVSAATPLPRPRKPLNLHDKWKDVHRKAAGRFIDSDVGLGDVVARMIDERDVEVRKVLYEEFGLADTWVSAFKHFVGLPCNCPDKQAKLNAMYPKTEWRAIQARESALKNPRP